MKTLCYLMTCGVAIAQTTAVFYDGTNLYSSGGTGTYTNITESMELVKPAYFCVAQSGSPFETAESYTLANGTAESGTVTNTWTINQSYLVIGESGQWDLQFAFTNITTDPVSVTWEGYYDGSGAHAISLSLWDYTSLSWDVLDADAIQTADGSDFSVLVAIPEPQTNYVASGSLTSRWLHTSSSNPTHDFATDYHAILTAQVDVPTAGVFQVISGYESCVTPNRFTVNTATGAITNSTRGVYDIRVGGSGTASAGATVRAFVYTNDVATDIGLYRTINSSGDIGNAWGGGLIDVAADTKIDVRFTTDQDNSHLSFVNFKFSGNKVDN